jgi:hypothetical protein
MNLWSQMRESAIIFSSLFAHRGLDQTRFRSASFDAKGWRRLVPSPSAARDNEAGLSKTRKPGKLANDPAAIW